MREGAHNHWPVIGGLSFSSAASTETTAEVVPPAEMPPTMKPFVGSAPSSDACAASHLTASQQSVCAVGNLCSGARRYPTFTTTLPKALTNDRAFGVLTDEFWSVKHDMARYRTVQLNLRLICRPGDEASAKA